MLTFAQNEILSTLAGQRTFLRGPAGCGKTTLGVAWLSELLAAGVDSQTILILTPQRSLQQPYLDLLARPQRGAGSEATPATIGGLARRACETFWPLAAESAGFAHQNQPPQFLTLETAQYYMAKIVRPLLDQGFFDSVTIDRNRLYSQILDNLNKAAIVGFPHSEIGARLDAAYFGEPVQRRIYADAQECASQFRRYCLENNLLDFSLQLEIFTNLLWQQPVVRQFLLENYRHLIYDNLEEDGARAHDLVRAWLPQFDSALLIYDESAGYRRFLGADPESGQTLAEGCSQASSLQRSFVISPPLVALQEKLVSALAPASASSLEAAPGAENFAPWRILAAHFYPELLEKVADDVSARLNEGLPPAEIAICSPYLSDALRFSLMNRLEARGVPVRSQRPSRSLRDEPASQALLTLARLAHPAWEIYPPRADVAHALTQIIGGLDLIRAQLLAEILYRPRDGAFLAFEEVRPASQERITYVFGEYFSRLRHWLLEYQSAPPLPLDHFLRKIFGELLSQPGFGFHANLDAIRVSASLVESVRKFRLALNLGEAEALTMGREYLQLLSEGVLAATHPVTSTAEQAPQQAVFLAPATTFLLMNRPVTLQYWLDAGSSGWHERLAQPITHPYVLARGWEMGRVWSDADEVESGRAALARLLSGLLRRCRREVILCLPEMDESGYEQRGELLRAFQKTLL